MDFLIELIKDKNIKMCFEMKADNFIAAAKGEHAEQFVRRRIINMDELVLEMQENEQIN